jgi:hypothetical protein
VQERGGRADEIENKQENPRPARGQVKTETNRCTGKFKARLEQEIICWSVRTRKKKIESVPS